jgi:outer membrane murein-binding lipoprotein Lpp
MWILDFLPGWIFTLITLAGAGAYLVTEVLGKVPFIAQYLRAIRAGAIIALVFGVYMMGGSANQEKWEARVKELEAKVAIAEEQSKTANAKLDAKMKEKVKVIKEKEYIIQEKIVQIKEKIDAMCDIPAEAINLLNESAEERQ